MLRDKKRKYNQVLVKLFSDGGENQKIKIVQMSTLRTSGIEDIGNLFVPCDMPESEPEQRVFYEGGYPSLSERSVFYDSYVENVLSNEKLTDSEKSRFISWRYNELFGLPSVDGFPDLPDLSDSEKKCVKMRESICRARSTIFELAFCNQWDLFFTGTLDPKKQNRSDLEQFRKDLTQFIRNKRRKYNADIKFLFVPELHSDLENWHIHGLISGLPYDCLTKFELGDVMGKYIAKKVQNGETVYSWDDYAQRFGFCDLEPVKNHEAVAGYISKYISKALDRGVKELGKHLYYCSRGLNRAEQIAKGTPDNERLSACLGAPSFEGEYCRVWWKPFSAELLAQFADSDLIVTPISENCKRF